MQVTRRGLFQLASGVLVAPLAMQPRGPILQAPIDVTAPEDWVRYTVRTYDDSRRPEPFQVWAPHCGVCSSRRTTS